MTRVRRQRAERVFRVKTRLLWVTAQAMCFDFPSEPGKEHTFLPRSAVHPNCALRRVGDEGELLVREWFAVKRGWLSKR